MLCFETDSGALIVGYIVFTGDSLVNGYDTITRLPGGSKKDFNSITKPYLDSLSDDTLIMPGHGDWALKGALATS